MSTNTTSMDMMHLVMVHGVGTLFGYHFVEDVLKTFATSYFCNVMLRYATYSSMRKRVYLLQLSRLETIFSAVSPTPHRVINNVVDRIPTQPSLHSKTRKQQPSRLRACFAGIVDVACCFKKKREHLSVLIFVSSVTLPAFAFVFFLGWFCICFFWRWRAASSRAASV